MTETLLTLNLRPPPSWKRKEHGNSGKKLKEYESYFREVLNNSGIPISGPLKAHGDGLLGQWNVEITVARKPNVTNRIGPIVARFIKYKEAPILSFLIVENEKDKKVALKEIGYYTYKENLVFLIVLINPNGNSMVFDHNDNPITKKALQERCPW